MSTACGHPQAEGEGFGSCGRMWTGGQKPDFFVDVINGWPLNTIRKAISKVRATDMVQTTNNKSNKKSTLSALHLYKTNKQLSIISLLLLCNLTIWPSY